MLIDIEHIHWNVFFCFFSRVDIQVYMLPLTSVKSIWSDICFKSVPMSTLKRMYVHWFVLILK